MKLKELRISEGFTQKKLAEALDVNQQTIARWENGKTEPSIAQLKDLAIIFGTSVDGVLGKAKVTSLYPKWFHYDKTDAYDDFFYGHLGITLCEGNITKWYPVTEKVATDFLNWNITMDGRIKMIFETMNNRYVWINLNHIAYITLNHDDSEKPLGDWKLTYKEKFHSEEFYKMMTQYTYENKLNISDKLMKTFENYCEKYKLDDDNIHELTRHTYIYGKDKMIFNRGFEVEEDSYPFIFSSLDDFKTNETLMIHDNDDSQYIFNISKLGMVDAPKYLLNQASDRLYRASKE